MSSVEKKDISKNENFTARAEDEIYQVAGIIGKDAKVVAEIAENVEKFSTNIKEEVTKVEEVVHQVKTSIDSIETSLDNVESILTHEPSQAQAQITNIVSNKPFSSLQRWSLFRILIFIAIFFVTIFLNWGTIKSSISDFESQVNEASTTPKTYRLFNLFLINIGPLIVALKFFRNFMKNEKKIISEVEGTVDEVAKEIKKTLDVVDEVAHVVEHASRNVEKKANMVQDLIAHEKSSTSN